MRSFCRCILLTLTVGLLSVMLAACFRAPVAVATPPPSPTPDPHEQALVERAVHDRLAEENRVTEQQLANARAAASQRRVGREMFLDLEAQYRKRQEEFSGNAPITDPPPAKPSSTEKQNSSH